MSDGAVLGPVSASIRQRLARLLNDHRVVVWYDPSGAFTGLAAELGDDLPNCVLVTAVGSRLRARRDAEEVYRAINRRRLNEAELPPEARRNLLLYLPYARPSTDDDHQRDLFEAFFRCGAAFGDTDGERLADLAQAALPDRASEIARMFRDGKPTWTVLDALPEGARFPLLRQALGSDAVVDAVAAALSRPDTGERLAAIPGALSELARLAETELGLPAGPARDWAVLRERLARYLLLSELAFDLPGGLPAALETVPHASPAYRRPILDICDRLRGSDAGREMLTELALAVEQALRLPTYLGDSPVLGALDTFPSQERVRLRAVVAATAVGDLAAARGSLNGGIGSVWRRDPERGLLWRTALRCLEFLELAEAAVPATSTSLRDLVQRYVQAEGWWRLDRAQRLYEQAAAQCSHDDEIEPLLQACRVRYRAVVTPQATAFQEAIKKEGWPPEGVRRQTETFDRWVAPELTERRRTAYFLVDSLRFEMGCDLAAALQDLGAVTLEPNATVLPTTTPCGMAALLPGAHGTFAFVEHGGSLVPALAGTPLPDVRARREFITRRYGDRVTDLTLEEVLITPPRRLRGPLAAVDLLLVRTQDIDELGESPSLYRARRVMTDVLGELRTAALRLAGLGFETLVFASDHGHVLVPEVLPGDVAAVPPGEWLLKKRRSLLGSSRGAAPGVLTLRAEHVGIVAPPERAPDFAVAAGLGTFRDGSGYFHEGLSLQECVVPVVAVRVRVEAPHETAGQMVQIAYRSDRFTSSVLNLKLMLTGMFSTTATIRLEAYESGDPRARTVGQPGECDALDPATGEIMLKAGVETSVPLVVDRDFQESSLEVRAIDPRTGAVLHRLMLKNARLD